MATRKKAKKKASKRSKLDALNVRQALFVLKYVELGNGTQAAIEAGYAKGSADVQASRLLGNDRVAQAIKDLRARVAERSEVSIERVVTELYRVLTADVGEAIDPDTGDFLLLQEWPEDLRRALSGMDVQVTQVGDGDEDVSITSTVKKAKFWSKTDAANLLLKKLGGFAPDKVEHTHAFVDVMRQVRERRGEG